MFKFINMKTISATAVSLSLVLGTLAVSPVSTAFAKISIFTGPEVKGHKTNGTLDYTLNRSARQIGVVGPVVRAHKLNGKLDYNAKTSARRFGGSGSFRKVSQAKGGLVNGSFFRNAGGGRSFRLSDRY